MRTSLPGGILYESCWGLGVVRGVPGLVYPSLTIRHFRPLATNNGIWKRGQPSVFYRSLSQNGDWSMPIG
jgi:hypothetical protein